MRDVQERESEFIDRLVHINRVAKVVKGGKRFGFAALVVVSKAAAAEYQGSIEAGSVSDAMAYHEAYAFLAIARDLATGLQADPLAGKAAGRALEVLAEADTAFGDMAQTTLEARDPAILLAIAARLELIGSTVR